MFSWLRSALGSRRSVSDPDLHRDLTSLAFEIRQGTVDQTAADVEWLLRPYMRTSKKRNQL